MTPATVGVEIGRFSTVAIPQSRHTMRSRGASSSLLVLLAVHQLLLLCPSRAQSGRSVLLRQMEVERIRLRILDEIGELPRGEEPRAPAPRSTALDVMMRTAEQEEEDRPETQIMILPEPGQLDCKRYTASPCSRFEYNVSSNVLPWTAKWMIDKSGVLSPENLTVWASCSSETVLLETEGEHEDWLLYSFPQQNWTLWKEDAKCDIEIAGASDVQRPLLTARRLEQRRPQQKRRGREVAPSSGCGVVPFRISFSEIGYDKFIMHPVSFDARFCEGECEGVRGHHEYLLGLLLGEQGRAKLRDGRCWATCCRPSRYGPIHLIHLEEDNTYAHRVMTNMIVEECACS